MNKQEGIRAITLIQKMIQTFCPELRDKIREKAAEIQFLNPHMRPDALGMSLSEYLFELLGTPRSISSFDDGEVIVNEMNTAYCKYIIKRETEKEETCQTLVTHTH